MLFSFKDGPECPTILSNLLSGGRGDGLAFSLEGGGKGWLSVWREGLAFLRVHHESFATWLIVKEGWLL